MSEEGGYVVVAVGTWMYDGTAHEIQLLARPARLAASRWVENQHTGQFQIDESTPVSATNDGFVYYVSATQGGEFLSMAEAIAWADRQPWGPVNWTFKKRTEFYRPAEGRDSLVQPQGTGARWVPAFAGTTESRSIILCSGL